MPTVPSSFEGTGLSWHEDLAGSREVRIAALRGVVTAGLEAGTLTGVEVRSRDLVVRAAEARLDTGKSTLEGTDWALRDRGIELRGRRLELDLQNLSVRAWSVRADLRVVPASLPRDPLPVSDPPRPRDPRTASPLR